MEENWSNCCQILTFLVIILFGLLGGTIAEKSNSVSFFHRHYDCIPVLLHNGIVVDSTHLHNGYHLDNVTLQFVAFGRQLKVDLSLNKHLFPQSYVERVFHYKEGGIENNTSTGQVPENCYYHGIVQGQPRSEAAISTCLDGISGYVTDRRDTYHIEPLKGRMHRVYRNSDQKKLPFRCGTVGHDSRFHSHQQVIQRYKRSIRAPYDSNRNTRYVELYLVNDYRTFERHGKATNVIIKRSQDIANIVSSLYRQLNIYVALVGVEVWGAGDRIIISKSADNTMENFLRYRRERINPTHHNDNAQLITGKFFEHGVVGKAIKGPICTHQYSGGVNMDYGGLVTLVATTVAHEMGHNFGMEHDNDTMCECRDEKCIMAATSGQISPRHWSSCSQNALAEAFDLGMDYCLRNLPTKVFEGPVCGNGFKEEGEECDCGLPHDCTNRCCNPTTCKMHSQAQCATGMCCDLVQCKPKMASTMCREPTGECDLPEYCNGNSEYCPDDFFVQNGHVCQQGESYCYNGQCNTHSNQCKLLWGETGRVSDPICFQQLNMNGDQDGSCAYNWTTNRYARCDKENVLCGLLHCVHLNEKLMFWKDNLALVMRASFLNRGNYRYVCRSAMLDVGLDMKDPGLVPDGAKCEENKICIDQKCVPLAKLDMEPCEDDCNGHGRCNSNNTCHCDVGYAPPLCDRPGYGGSLSSGPATNEYVPTSTKATRRVTSTKMSTTTTTTSTNITIESDSETDFGAKKDLLVALLIVLVVLIFIVLGILAYCNRGRLRKWLNRMPDINYRVKGKSEKNRPPSLLDSTTPVSRSDSSHSSGNHTNHIPQSEAWIPVKTVVKVPPKRPAVAPKRLLSGTKSGSDAEKEMFTNESFNFASNQSEVSTTASTPVLSNSTHPNSPPTAAKGIVKRESMRGSKISDPVLMSTTNRNSVVLADMQVSIIGPEADREPRSNSPCLNLKPNNTIKRSLSDRQPTRPDVLSDLPVTHLLGGGTLRKSASVKPKTDTSVAASNDVWAKTRPETRNSLEMDEEKELIYANEMDMGGLLQDIEQQLKTDSFYCNLSNGGPPESAVLEVDNPPEIPSRKSQSAAKRNGVDNNKGGQFTAKLSETQNGDSSIAKHANKNAASSLKENHSSTPPSSKSINSDKTGTPRSNHPMTELKSRLQTKLDSTTVSPKNVTNNSSAGAKTHHLADKPSIKTNSPSSSISNSSMSRTNDIKNRNNSPANKRFDAAKASKPSLSRTDSAPVVSSNKKPSVSNLAAKFNQGADDADEKLPFVSKPVLKRNQTVPGFPDKPAISAKPVPPPKPVSSGERSPTTRPTVGIKRVQSYRI